MKKGPPTAYLCSDEREPLCQKPSKEEVFDPRSYCHSILSKRSKVCRKHTCRKFLRTNEERTKGEVVCIPRPPCKLKRHFGPTLSQEDFQSDDDDSWFFRQYGSQMGLILNEGTVSDTDVLRCRFAGRKAIRIRRDGRYGGRDAGYSDSDDESDTEGARGRRGKPGKGGIVTKYGIVQDQETGKLLEELSKYLDPEGMAAITALAGADLCPCCGCKVCRCKLRGVTSETLLVLRKKALLEQRLRKWGGKGYAWSFDYFYKPDLEYFERDRERRIQEERRQALEEERELIIQELMKEGELPEEFLAEQELMEGSEGAFREVEEMSIRSLRFAEVQAAPPSVAAGTQSFPGSLKEEEVSLERVEKMSLQSSARSARSVSIRSDRQEAEEILEKFRAEGKEAPGSKEWKKYEMVEWGGRKKIQGAPSVQSETDITMADIRSLLGEPYLGERYVRQSLARSSIESWVETRRPLEEGRRPTTILDASREPIDLQFPEGEIRAEVSIPSRVSEEESKESEETEASEISTARLKDEGWAGELKEGVIKKKVKKRKKAAKKSGDKESQSIRESVASSVATQSKKSVSIRESEVSTEIAEIPLQYETPQEKSLEVSSEQISAPPTTSEAPRDAIDISLSSKQSYGVAYEKAKAKLMAKRMSVSPSMRVYADYCNCLPGFCTCGKRHFIFEKVDEATEIKPIVKDRTVQVKAEEELGEIKAEDLSDKSSCICEHPWDEVDDLIKLTPEPSFKKAYDKRSLKKERELLKIKRPRYQKTLILVKPEGMRCKDVILRAIKAEGLDLIDQRLVHLTPEQVTEIYNENVGSAYFPMYVQRMSMTPILVLCVAGINVIDRWKKLIGHGEVIPSSWFYPESIRRRFGLLGDFHGAMRASSNFDNAKNELKYFFPLDIIEPIIIESAEVQDYCDKFIHPTLLRALYHIAKERPEKPLDALAEWLLKNNPYQPNYPDPLVSLSPL